MADTSPESQQSSELPFDPKLLGFAHLMAHSVIGRDEQSRVALEKALNDPDDHAALSFLAAKVASHPNDPALLFLLAERHLVVGAFEQATQTLAKILSDPLGEFARWVIAFTNVRVAYAQSDFTRAHRLCEQFLASAVVREGKAAFIDHFICLSLYNNERAHLPELESWARRALELEPNNRSIHGTLGHILVELGRDAEAELFLQTCLNSSALHDKGISLYCLARIREREGKSQEATRLLQQALIYFDAPWFTARVKARLAQISR